MIKYSELTTEQKMACLSLFPEEAKTDTEWYIRIEAYRAFGYTEEAKNDNNWYIRREAYRALGYTEESKTDTEWYIRIEAEIYFKIKNQLEQQTTEEQTIQLNGKIYKLIEITNE